MIQRIGRLDGNDVLQATLQVGVHQVHILNYGCVVRRWLTDLGHHGTRDIVLGFDSFDDYPEHSRSFGIVAGRVANRTCHGRFVLDNRSYQLSLNNGEHHLHGGITGLGRRLWSMEIDSTSHSVRLAYPSPDGEEGYPGNVSFEVIYQLDEAGLHCTMRGQPDIPTPINLAQHNYYNLGGTGDIRQHSLFVDAEHFLAVDEQLIPTGVVTSVENTRFDFRTMSCIDTVDPDRLGHDQNMVLRAGRDPQVAAATLISADELVKLEVVTPEPGIQLFTAASMQLDVAGLNGAVYGQFAGICLEAQHYPDSLNHPEFPTIIATPEIPYEQTLALLVSC